MPNYFTMKMRGGTESPDDRKTVTDFVKETSCIGVGEPEYTTGAGTFLNDIQIGDIIVLRAGRGPVALLKVVSDSYEYKSEGKFPAFDSWLAYTRKVEVISWYEKFCESYPGFIFDARGYMQTCAAITGDNLPIVQFWHEKTKPMSDIDDKEENTEAGVRVYFRKAEAETDAEAFENGWNTVANQIEEDDVFEVERGYTSWYVIGDDCFSLSPGTYRFHEGEMQVHVHGGWKHYRHDEEDF